MTSAKIKANHATLFFVEAALTGSGLMHVHWAINNGIDAWFITANAKKYEDVLNGQVISQLRQRDRLLQVETTEGENLPADLVKATLGIAGKIGVVCVSDRNLLFAANFAEKIGASFASSKAIQCLRDKRKARELFDELCLPSARWLAPGKLEDVARFADRIKAPVVVKNCCGTGSLDVKLCFTPDQAVQSFLEMGVAPRYLDGDLMLEEYLHGPLVSLEVLVVEGRPIVLGITDRQLGPLPNFCEVSYTFPIHLPDSIMGSMAATVEAITSHLRIPQGFLHVEFVVTEQGPKLVEINPRLGGGLLAKMMNDALTVSVSELICLSALEELNAVPELRGNASSTVTVYPDRHGRLKSLEGLMRAAECPFVCDVIPNSRVGDEIAPPRDYRGAICQIRATAGSSALAYNSALVAAQLVIAELGELA